MKFLTNLLFEPKGMHDPALAYSIKDTVMSGDGSRVYFAIQDVPAGIPLNDSNYWKLQIDLSGSKSAMDQALASFADYAKVIGMRVRGETAKAAGNPVTFLPDAGSLLQPVTVLEPQQQGSGDPSPSNIRPIIGYDALGLTAAGKNLLDVSGAAGEQDGLRFVVNEDGSITITGTATGSGARLIGVCAIPNGGCVFSQRNNSAFNGTATVYCEGTSVDINIGYSDASGVIENGGVVPVRMWWAAGTSFDSFVVRMMIEAGVYATDHKPYTGKAHTVQIGQTVYGGRMDWLTGKFVVTDELRTYNGSEGWFGNSGGNDSLFAISLDTTVNSVSACSHTPVVNETVPQNIIGSGYYTEYGVLYMNLTGGQRISIEEFRAKLAASPVQITYKLANPIEIQLAPHIISAADPEQTNTLYGDGRIDVEYVKPLHVSIEERVAAAMNTEGV